MLRLHAQTRNPGGLRDCPSARRPALWGLAATALLWSTGGVAIKAVALSPMAIAGGRGLVAGLFLLAVFFRQLDFRLHPAKVGAACCYAAMLLSNVAATKLTTAANAILLAYTAPIYVALLAPAVLGERTCRADWLAIGVTLAGMVLFFLDGLSPSGWWGNILAVGTGLAYAGFMLAMRAGREDSPLAAIVLGHGLTALVGLPFLVAGPPGTAGDWLGLGYLGLIQQGASLILYVWCIRRVAAVPAMLVLTLEPLCNPVWVAIGQGELPGPWAMAGGALVVGAVTLRGVAAARTMRRPVAA